MEAIILAGGFGTRLRPFTYTRAKSLLPILNKPMISYLISTLPNKVNKIIVAVNYRKDQIEEYFNKNNFGKEIIVNDEPKPLGTAGAVKFADKHISGPFFVLNADTICSLDINKMIDFHNKKNAFCTISLWPIEKVSEFGVVDIKGDGNVIGFVEKPKPEDAPSDLINAGAYLLKQEVLDYIETDRLVSMEKEIFPRIINDTGKFYGYKIEGHWIDVGRIKSYIDVNKLLMENSNLHFFKGNNSTIKGKLIKSCIGNNVLIEDNSKIESTVIMDNVKIEKDVKLYNCVIGENCIVKHNSKLTNTAVGDYEIVDENTFFDNKIIWNQPIPKGYPKKQIGNVIGE